MSAGMMACRGRVQQENGVVHLIAEHLTDLTALLDSVGQRGEAFRVPHGRSDEARPSGGPGERREQASRGRLQVPTRDFR
jgi:error-prone DNA polymerase